MKKIISLIIVFLLSANMIFAQAAAPTNLSLKGIADWTRNFNFRLSGSGALPAVPAAGIEYMDITDSYNPISYVSNGSAWVFKTSKYFNGGDAAAPGISFFSDRDTGIFAPVANHIQFSTGGVARWFISSAGDLITPNELDTTLIGSGVFGGAIGFKGSTSTSDRGLLFGHLNNSAVFTQDAFIHSDTGNFILNKLTDDTINKLQVVGNTKLTGLSFDYGNENSFALKVGSSDNAAKSLLAGYSETADCAVIDSVHTGVAWKNLAIKAQGGAVLIGSTTADPYQNNKLQVNGFTRLGENGIGLKCKLITGVSPVATATPQNYPHGLNGLKIVSCQILLEFAAGAFMSPNNDGTGYSFIYYFDGTNVSITANDANVTGKGIKILLWYME